MCCSWGGCHFDTVDSSMSAVVQELYAGLQVALSAELTALSEPKIVLDAQPEESDFVLSCGSDLPSEHQRNGLKICSQDSDERLDCAGKVSCPGPMEIISKEPTEAGDLAEDAEAQNRSLLKQDSLCRNVRDVAEEDLAQSSLITSESCSKWESLLNEEEKGFLSRSSCAEITGLLPSLEENPATMQVTTESLPNPMKEEQGMKADGTRLFRESSARVSTGIPPENSECSNVDNVMAKVVVSETSTLFSHEPVNVMDNASSEEHSQKEDKHQELTACTALLAPTGACVSCGSEPGGETSFSQHKDATATLSNNLPSMQEKKNLHANLYVPVSESLVAVADQLSDVSSGTSSLHFKSCLEFGRVFWEENMNTSDVTCEMLEEYPLGKEDSLKSSASCEITDLLEEGVPKINMKKPASPVWSSEDSSMDDEQEMSSSYSSVSKEDCEHQGSEEHLEGDTSPDLSETDSIQKEMDQRCVFPIDRYMATEVAENKPALVDASNVCRQETLGTLQNSSSVSINSVPTYHDSLGGDTKLHQEGLLKIESNRDVRKGLLNSASAAHLHATSTICIEGTNLDEENNETIQLSDEHSFTQQVDVTLSTTRFAGSMASEGFPGLCAKLESESTDCLLPHRMRLLSTNQKCGSCVLTNVLSSLSNTEKVTDVATPQNTEEVDGLELGRASVHIRIVDPPQECNVNGLVSPPSESSWGHLDGTCRNLDSVWSVDVSSTGLSQADSSECHVEAENQRRNDGNCSSSSVNAKETLDVDISIYPAGTNLEQELIKASLEVNDRMEMVESVEVCENCPGSNMSEKSVGGRGLNKTIQPLKLNSFTKGQIQEELEKYQARPSSSSDLNTDLSSNHRSCIKQQDRPILDKNPAQHHMRIQAIASQDYHLIGLDSFNQKNLTPQETIVLTHQQHVLVTSKKQMEDTIVQTVNCSLEETKKSVTCSQDELVCPKRVQDKTPQTHPWLLIKNGVHEKFQPSLRGSSSAYKKASESISNPLNGGLIKLRNSGMLLECVGHASELMKLNKFVQEWGRWREAEFCSVLQSVRRSSEMQHKKCCLKFSSKHTLFPSHNSFLPNSLMFTATNGWRTTEGVCSKLFKDSLVCISLGVQPTQSPEACLPEKDDTSTSLSLNVVESSPAAEVALKRKRDDHVCLVFSEVGKSSCPFKEVVYVGSPPGSKVILVSTVHSMTDVEVEEILPITSSGPDLSKKTKQSSDNDHSLITEKVKIPVHYRSKEPSRALSDLLRVGKEGNTITFKSEIYVRPLFPHPLECISELSSNERHTHAKDPSKSAAVKQRALCPKDAFPSMTPGAFYNTVSCASLSDSMFEALAKCFGNKERNLQSTEKRVRDQRKPLDYLVSIDTETHVNKRTSETGDSPTFMQEGMQESSAECTAFSDVVSQQHQANDKGEAENVFRQRFIRTGYPVARSSNEVVAWIVGKLGDPTWTLVVGSFVKDREKRHPCRTLRDLKRPERSSDLIGWEYMEAKDSEVKSPKLCFRNQSQQSTNISIPVPVLCMLPQTFGFRHGGIQITSGSEHRIRQSLPLRRRSGNIYKKDPMQGHFKVRRKSNKIKCSAFLKTFLETVPGHRSTLISSACLAMKPAAIENKVTMVWDQTPKQRANRSSLVGLSEHTKDSAVLKRLSALASNLLVPSTNPQKFKLPMSSAELFSLTAKNSQRRRKKLLEVFSWVNVKLSFQWIKGSSYSTKMFNSQSLALYPIESTNMCVLEQSSKACLAFCIPTFPLSFHIKMGSSPMALREPEVLQPAKRTFSFLLSESSLGRSAIHEGACVPAESCILSASLHAAKDSRRYAVAKRRSGCSMLGLQTVLALYSPGCYRVWTRKRNLTSQIPTIQRLTVLQFSQGLKGLKCSTSISADLFSSLPYLLGRVLSIWSQHGPSTCPSEFTPLHSNHCKWQPLTTATTSLGFGNSSAMLPHLPDQVVEAPSIAPEELRLEPYFSASLPTSCPILEPEHPAVGLLAPEFESHPLDEVSLPAPPTSGTQLEKAKLEKRPKKVSQIRIRKTVPKDPNLTPMGLPRPKRLKKTEFSLEEIYTNKNYKSPPATRCLETIFEEPKEKNGSLISVSQQKRKRILEFQDFTIPRKRKTRSRVKVMGSFTRAQKAALEGRELDALLIQKLTDLETFFAMEEEQEQGHMPGS